MRAMLGILLFCIPLLSFIGAEITISSKNGDAQLLQLFDVRNQVAQPFFLIEPRFSGINLVSEPVGGSTVRRTVVDSHSEYVENLNVEGDARLDLMLKIGKGGGKIAGSVEFNDRTSSHKLIAVIEIIKKKKQERVNLCDPFWSGKVDKDIARLGKNATHVFTAKVFGVRAEIACEMENIEKDSVSAIKSQMKAEMEGLFGSASGGGAFSRSGFKSNKTILSKTKIYTYCHMVNCPRAPRSFDEIENFITQIYEKFDLSETDGSIIEYKAEDLESVKECLSFEYLPAQRNQVSLDNANRIEAFVKTAEEAMLDLHIFASNVKRFRNCISPDFYSNVTNVTGYSTSYVASVKDLLRNTVIEVQFGRKVQSDVQQILNDFSSNDTNPIQVMSSVKTLNRLWYQKVEFYRSRSKENMQCLDTSLSLVEMSDSQEVKIFFFLFDNQTFVDNQEFLNDLSKFTTLCKTDDSVRIHCFLVDCTFDFSVCANATSSKSWMFYHGQLKLVSSALPELEVSEINKIRAAITYLYVDTAKVYKLLSGVDRKVELHNENVKRILKTLHANTTGLVLPNITYLFEHDAFERQRKNRTRKNNVEIFLGKFLDLEA